MYDGEEKTVKLLVENSYIGVIIDRFGKDIPIMKKDDTHVFVNVNVAVSNHFYAWVLSMNDKIEIVGPESVRDEVRDYVKRLNSQYNNS